jgi:hypothetical protein
MLHTLVVYIHLLATCVAIGTIVVTDTRLLAKLAGYKIVIPAPARLETRIITLALVVLYFTGGLLLWLGWEKNPQYLTNQKLQAKLLLVGVLTLNALVLHGRVFPILQRALPVSQWTRKQWLTVSLSVSLSNSLWFYCAFLGIARPWNFMVHLGQVLCLAVWVWAGLLLVIHAVLVLASRDAPKPRPDWIDSVKSSLSHYADLAE